MFKMSVEKLTGMWAELKKSNRVPKDTLLMGTCESELQELMKQVDIMTHNKFMEWDKERQSYMSRLQLKDQEATLLQVSVKKKDKEITSLQQKVETLQQSHTDMVIQYETQLNNLREQVSSVKRSYEKLQKKYQKQSKEASQQAQKMAKQLQSSSEETERVKVELLQLKQIYPGRELNMLKDTRQNNSLQDKVHDLEQEIHQRNLATATLSEKLTVMERQLRDQDELLDRKNAEVEVANAQLEALRLENRHLRKAALSRSAVSADVASVEGSLKEIQDAYASSLARLETENHRLHDEVRSLRHELAELRSCNDSKIQRTLRETEQTVRSLKQRHKDHLSDVEGSKQLQIDRLQEHLEATVREHEDRIRELQFENSSLRQQVDSRNRSLRGIGLENDALNEFALGVDEIVRLPPHRDYLYSPASHELDGFRPIQTPPQMTTVEGGLSSNRVSLMERFLAEEQERARELEKQLDVHIQTLKNETDSTLKKYHPHSV